MVGISTKDNNSSDDNSVSSVDDILRVISPIQQLLHLLLMIYPYEV